MSLFNCFITSFEVRNDANIMRLSAYCSKVHSRDIHFSISLIDKLSNNGPSTVLFGKLLLTLVLSKIFPFAFTN